MIRFTRSIFIILFSILFVGCISKKKIILFQDAKESINIDTSAVQKANTLNTLKIQPFDVLDIRVTSTDKALSNLTESKATTSGVTGIGGYFTAYHVDSRGIINLPLIGDMVFTNLTINEAKERLRERLKEYLVDPYVDIKFLTFRITVIGEVKNPGIVTVPNEKASLIDVLALSGDLTDFGDRTKIKILRGNPTKPTIFIIDLTKYEALSQKGFILMPNDVVYVEPLSRKFALTNLTTALSFGVLANLLNIFITLSR